jgi:hypothetical protein
VYTYKTTCKNNKDKCLPLYSKCHVTSNKAKSNLEWAEGGGFEGVTSERRPVETGRTSVKKLLPPQAMRGIRLEMRGLVRSYVTLAIKRKKKIKILWHIDPLLGNDRKISNYSTDIAK